jgi:CspA family cold shock protein
MGISDLGRLFVNYVEHKNEEIEGAVNTAQDTPKNIEMIQCMVKWFSPFKGYGFVVPEGMDEDIFLHFSVLDKAGYEYVNPGDRVLCDVLSGDKGRQVQEIHEVRITRQVPGQGPQFQFLPPSGTLETAEGEVKWFSSIRGFGFVTADNGGRDIFVHISVLRRCGLQKIVPGQRVRMDVRDSNRGRQAQSITVIAEAPEGYEAPLDYEASM